MAREPNTIPPRRRRRWPWVLGVLLLVPLAALSAFLLWSRTEHALATTAAFLERASGGRLELQGVAGSLYGPITVEQLVIRDARGEMRAEALALDWSPRALLAATLQVNRLTVRSVSVTPAAGERTAAAFPASLRVPLRIALRDVRIERVTVQGDAPLEFSPVAGSATFGLTRHSVVLHGLGTPWARVDAELSVGAWIPYRVDGHVRLDAIRALPLDSAELNLGGRLARIELTAALKGKGFSGRTRAVLAPFEREPLRATTIALRDVNLAALNLLLPATRVALDADLKYAGGALSGPVSATNALAGRIDSGRIPLSQARGRLRFDGTRLKLENLSLALADAGQARGRAELGRHGYALDLATDGLQLDRLYGALRALRLAGHLHLSGGGGDGDRLDAQLTEGDYALALRARRADERVTLESATLRVPGGEVSAHGHLLLDETRTFTLNARLKNFDPAGFVDLPPARLNASVEATGVLRPEWRTELKVRLADSRFAQAPLSGEAMLSLTRQRIIVQKASLAAGANRASADGRFGAPGDRLNLRLDAPQLARLGLGASGALRVSGWIGGRGAEPAVQVEAQGRELEFRGFKAGTLSIAARAPEGIEGKLSLRASVGEAHALGRSLAKLEATLEGTRRQHTLRAAIEDPALSASLRAQGGLSDAGEWNGRVEALQATQPRPAHLVGPVALRWRPGRLEVGAGRVVIAGGELRFDQLSAGDGMLSSRGRLERVALAALLPPPGPAASFQTDLVLSGAWNIDAGKALSGSLHLQRDRGDVVLRGDGQLPLEISELRLDVKANANAIEASLRGQGAKLGALEANLRTTAQRSAGTWWIAPDAPLVGRARFTIPSLSWLGRLINPQLRTGGNVSGQLAIDGSLRDPRLQGALNGTQLRVRYGSAGVRLRDGDMRIELAQDKVIFRRVAFRGDEGTLTASGAATLAQGKVQLDLEVHADKLAAVRRDDQQLVVSGTGHVRSRDGQIALEGSFTADRGLIELHAEDAPRLSSDVVIVTQQPKAQVVPERLRIDMTLDLGKAFYVRGQGLDVRMEGQVRVTLEEGEIRPHAHGSVRVVEGHYAAYGQQLTIQRGVLRFEGPLDNPKLDILAVRKGLQVEAGVLISGTALSPHTALYSNPPVPDSQKMQWLVFGGGPGSAGDAEFGLSGRTQQRDEFVSVGAQLATAVYVSVGQSVRNASSFVQATVDLTERLAVQGRTGAENGITLIYTWAFD
jgi:translocation and assembly module TamB